MALVEGALERTNPGKGFTLGVIAAIPAMTISTKAATLGVNCGQRKRLCEDSCGYGIIWLLPQPDPGGVWQLRELPEEHGRGPHGRRTRQDQNIVREVTTAVSWPQHDARCALVFRNSKPGELQCILWFVVLQNHHHLFSIPFCICV
jgi:hypothetical protein